VGQWACRTDQKFSAENRRIAPHAAQATAREPPEASIRRVDLHDEVLASAAGLDAHRDDHGDGDDPTVWRTFTLVASINS
jgi:hypothetical protein